MQAENIAPDHIPTSRGHYMFYRWIFFHKSDEGGAGIHLMRGNELVEYKIASFQSLSPLLFDAQALYMAMQLCKCSSKEEFNSNNSHCLEVINRSVSVIFATSFGYRLACLYISHASLVLYKKCIRY